MQDYLYRRPMIYKGPPTTQTVQEAGKLQTTLLSSLGKNSKTVLTALFIVFLCFPCSVYHISWSKMQFFLLFSMAVG